MISEPESDTGPPIHDPPKPVDGLLPRLELDDLLSRLIERAEELRAVHERLGELIRANHLITEDLALPVVLRRIVEAACQLVHARYGALGVLGPDGGLASFIQVGIEPQQAELIGDQPQGKGLLGALICDPQPIRLADIGSDRRSVGFPEHHPAMAGFLGVPIRIRGTVFGNLYLAGRPGDAEFTEQDQELVVSLATNAAIAIENARLYDEARRRQLWLAASADITQQLLSAEGEDPLTLIARRTREVAEADSVTVILPGPVPGQLMVEVAEGRGADKLRAMTFVQESTLSAHVLETGVAVLIEDVAAAPAYRVQLDEVLPIGALMALPLVGAEKQRGVLLVARLRGRPRFTQADLDMANTFANHAAIALELADARSDQQRVALLEDRDRIARDLHDLVIQRLFAIGLTIESVASGLPAAKADRLTQVIDELDETIRQIRTSIFQLHCALGVSRGVRIELIELVDEMADSLGFRPQLDLLGPVDTLVDAATGHEVVAVLREALTNVARHAAATSVRVVVRVEAGRLAIEVSDNGRGLAGETRRSGLDNLRRRAEDRGGDFLVTSPWSRETSESNGQISQGGTRLLWTIPLS